MGINLMKCVGGDMANHYKNIRCHFLSVYTLATAVNSCQFLQEKKKMHSPVPIDHTSNGVQIMRGKRV